MKKQVVRRKLRCDNGVWRSEKNVEGNSVFGVMELRSTSFLMGVSTSEQTSR